jgi:predicted Zn finger-like uncharacterized protein
MPEDKFTRCPDCKTVFRVTPEQLALRAGQVRCGRCKTVFDGVAQHVVLAAGPTEEPGSAWVADAAAGAALHDGAAARAATGEGAAGAAPRVDAATNGGALTPTGEATPVESAPGTPSADAAASGRAEGGVTAGPRSLSAGIPTQPRSRTAFQATLIAVLVLLIAGQAVFHFRDAIAARWPAARAPLERLCDAAGCAIRPLRDGAMSYLSIDASDLQADPAHRGLLILTATLRNRAGWSLAYPHLELTLTDAQDRVVVRRALSPADYAGGTADLQRGIGPNGEIAVKVFIDASATLQAGYRLYMFYP